MGKKEIIMSNTAPMRRYSPGLCGYPQPDARNWQAWQGRNINDHRVLCTLAGLNEMPKLEDVIYFVEAKN